MHRDIIISCLPYMAAIAVSMALLRLLLFVSGARLKIAHLRRLHRDQTGGVQSLSFVLTLPLFVMMLMFIVQLSQITIGKIIVEYAAFATARSAMVWIPATTASGDEQENRISNYRYVGEETAGGLSYSIYDIQPGSQKHDRIHLAAASACLPICPSRDAGVDRDHPGNRAANSLTRAYLMASPSSSANTRIPARISNKLAYALKYTDVSIRVKHKDEEPPLTEHDILPYRDEFAYNEIGWQDQLTVTVSHDFALLPGPGRLLARRVRSPTGTSNAQGRSYGSDEVAERIENKNGVYVYRLTSTVRLSNEGEKPLLPVINNPVSGDEEEEMGDDQETQQEQIFDRDLEYYERDLENGPLPGVRPPSEETEFDSDRNSSGRPAT